MTLPAQAANADVDAAVAAARTAFDNGPWPHTIPEERQEVIRRYDALRAARADEIAAAISAENGSAGWFTKAGQPFLTRQVNAYLKAAEEFGWEEVVEPSDPRWLSTPSFGARRSAWSLRSSRGTRRSPPPPPSWSPRCWPATPWY
ncbi:hypothetical protein GCM10027614_20820 [Micromonospora vulcania]